MDSLNNGSPTPTGNIEPLDLFRYGAAGVRSFTTSAAATSYFSIDGGTTNLVGFNQYSPAGSVNDYGDWFSNNGAGATVPRVQDSNGTSGSEPNLNVELTRLDILGFTLTSLPGPQITVSSQASTEGISHSFSLGNFTDAAVAPYSVTVNWGDGSPTTTFDINTAGSLGTLSHTYAEEGNYNASVTVTDFASGTQTQNFQVSVADATLTAGGATALTPKTGVALPSSTVVGTFTDANPTAPISDYTGTIDWGDGSPTTLATFSQPGGVGTAFDVTGGHTYAKPGTYAITVNVLDDGGSRVTLTGTSTVTDLPVTGSTKNFTAVEGESTGSFVLATFEDPNTLATLSDVQAQLAIGGWGDGTPTAAGVTLTIVQIGVDATNGDPVFNVVGTHTYADETAAGTPDPLSVIITTVGGATTTLTSPPGGGVTVLDAPLTSSSGTSITGVEGNSTGTVLLGTFRDGNQGATVADFTAGGGSVVVNWGDGSAPQTLAAGDVTPVGTADGIVWTIDSSHLYMEEGTYAYNVTVTDAGGAFTIFSGSAIIQDATLAPTPTQPPVNTTEATVFPVPVFEKAGTGTPPQGFVGAVASFTETNPFATASDYSATIDWGDGTALTAGTVTVAAASPPAPLSLS